MAVIIVSSIVTNICVALIAFPNRKRGIFICCTKALIIYILCISGDSIGRVERRTISERKRHFSLWCKSLYIYMSKAVLDSNSEYKDEKEKLMETSKTCFHIQSTIQLSGKSN